MSKYQEQAKATTRWMIERIERAIKSDEPLTWANGCDMGLPVNFTTGKFYRGWNIFRLWMAGYPRPLFAGIGQILNCKGRVKREEYGRVTWINLWARREVKQVNPDTGKEETRAFWYSKALKVYNIEQCEGLDESRLKYKAPKGASTDAELDAIFAAVATAETLKVREDAPTTTPAYAPLSDEVLMPARARFLSTEAYYAAKAHEFMHASGHAARLDRGLFLNGRHDYSKEELVAEFGAAILGAVLGFDGGKAVENHAAYLRGWLKALQDDPMLLMEAASAAQKAVDRFMEKAGSALPERVRVMLAPATAEEEEVTAGAEE